MRYLRLCCSGLFGSCCSGLAQIFLMMLQYVLLALLVRLCICQCCFWGAEWFVVFVSRKLKDIIPRQMFKVPIQACNAVLCSTIYSHLLAPTASASSASRILPVGWGGRGGFGVISKWCCCCNANWAQEGWYFMHVFAGSWAWWFLVFCRLA